MSAHSKLNQTNQPMNQTDFEDTLLSVSEILSIHSSASCDDLKEQKQINKFILSKWYDKSTRETFIRWATEPMAPKWRLGLVCSSLLVQEPLFQKLATWEQMSKLLRCNDNLDEATIANCAIGWCSAHETSDSWDKTHVLAGVRWERIRCLDLVDLVSRNRRLIEECLPNEIYRHIEKSASCVDIHTEPTSKPRGVYYSWRQHTVNLELGFGLASPDLCPTRFRITPLSFDEASPVIGIFNPCAAKGAPPKLYRLERCPHDVFVEWSHGVEREPVVVEKAGSEIKSVTIFVDRQESDQYRVGCYHCDVSSTLD